MKKLVHYYYSRFGIFGVINAVLAKVGIPNRLITVRIKGIKEPFHLRTKSTDSMTFDQIFLDQEYRFRPTNKPKVIIDAGANIGLVSILFANRWPNAKIIAIEPEKDNYQLLKKNTAPYKNIFTLQAALWNKNEEIILVDSGTEESENWGYITENKDSKQQSPYTLRHSVNGMTINRIMQDYQLTEIDILKVDIEGAEKEVFSDTSAWIDHVKSIITELHEEKKPGCKASFYTGATGFNKAWCLGENIYLSKDTFPLNTLG